MNTFVKGLVFNHAQIQGTEHVNTGKIAEQKVLDALAEIRRQNNGWLTIQKRIPWKPKKSGDLGFKSFDLAIKIETPTGSAQSLSPEYIGIEIAWQETGNSVIYRKSSEYREDYEIAETLGHSFCLVVDGVGYFSRANAMDEIVASSHCSVGLSDSELAILKQFIEKKIQDYRTRAAGQP